MRRILFLVVLALAAAAAVAQTPAAGVNTAIVASWTPPVGAVCSATVTTACLKGYTGTFTPPAGVAGVNIVSIAAVSSYTWKPGGNLYCGTWTVSLVANWLDGSGNSASSAAAIGTAVEPCPFVPNPPTGLSTKVQ